VEHEPLLAPGAPGAPGACRTCLVEGNTPIPESV
jgi:hypothetical protein